MKPGLFFLILYPMITLWATDPGGFNDAPWGSSQEQVRKIINPVQWLSDPSAARFPADLKITVYRTNAEIAGNRAIVRYYFHEDSFFQATVFFDFEDLKSYDFNYNVFRSVNEYYTVIRSRTLVFVHDIYDLLKKKYGMKEPVFKGLDPRTVFVKLDSYVRKERWNLRYHPYDYYLKINTSAYAEWDFPKTRVIFSINISASDKRFDYTLSLSSLKMEDAIKKKMDRLRMKGL
ncbi:MAG: hypothetical protein GX267_19275 [Fibrobacter sp.]|jgi:hypothetical protein|nr:hypothetical protein [Fibrobacter sp.]